MRKRNLITVCCLMLAAGVLLSACAAKPDIEVYDTLAASHSTYTSYERAALGFMMETTFRDEDSGETGVLYYIQGDCKYDKHADLAWQKFTATVLGATFNVEEYYAQGNKMHIESGEVYPLESPGEAFFGAFPYCAVPLPVFSNVKSLTQESNGSGTLYTLVAETGQKELIEDIWQLDLYSLAGVSVPNRDKERFGEVTYTFSVKDGKLSSLTVKVTASIYETPGYTPGYTPDDENYRLDLTVTVQISVKDTGKTIEVPVYSEANE